jgi:hypothetical protein
VERLPEGRGQPPRALVPASRQGLDIPNSADRFRTVGASGGRPLRWTPSATKGEAFIRGACETSNGATGVENRPEMPAPCVGPGALRYAGRSAGGEPVAGGERIGSWAGPSGAYASGGTSARDGPRWLLRITVAPSVGGRGAAPRGFAGHLVESWDATTTTRNPLSLVLSGWLLLRYAARVLWIVVPGAATQHTFRPAPRGASARRSRLQADAPPHRQTNHPHHWIPSNTRPQRQASYPASA